MEPRRNDPCPCGSGKKYKNCCIKNAVLQTTDRVFSYSNYQLIYGFSPFLSMKDWENLKEIDGRKAKYIGLSYNKDSMYMIQSPWGYYPYHELATRVHDGKDVEISNISRKDFNELISKITYLRRLDFSTWPFEFHTVAFITNENYSFSGFCLVSTSPDTGKFLIRSEIYPISKQTCREFLQFLYDNNIIWPVGELTLEFSQDVFVFHVDLLERFLRKQNRDSRAYTYITKEELYEYLLHANDKSQYYPNPAINVETIRFRQLAVKYRTHCRLLMEQICSDESLQTTLNLIKSKEWLNQIAKAQNSDLDPETDFSGWMEFEKKINSIIDEMKNSGSQLIYEAHKEYIDHKYPHLSSSAREFLATAETLYELNKNISFDFAPLAVEYGKVLEAQLRIIVKNDNDFEDMRTFGELLRNIQNPYSRRIREMKIVCEIRNQGAHPQAVTMKDVEEVRHIFFEEGLLDALKYK